MTFSGCPIWVSMEGVVIGKIIVCSVAAVENDNLINFFKTHAWAYNVC